MSATVRDFSRECWTEVMNRVIGAVVFLDEPSAENLHWHGGLSALLEAGAVAVKTLSPFEFAGPDQKKLLFVSSCTSTQLQSVRGVLGQSSPTHCVLVSTASLDVVAGELAGDSGGDLDPVRLIENMLVEWISKKQIAVEVIHIPVFTISPSPLLFLLPAFSDLTTTFQGRLMPDDTSVDLSCLSETERVNVRRLATSLSSMFGAMNIKEDIFYMGPYSSLVAGVLEYNPQCCNRRKTCTQPASLVIVDRTLDLCPVTSHLSDCVLDKLLSVLPNFPHHSTDVAVDMSPLCEANMVSVTEDIQLSPGCLWHEDDVCVQTFEYMMNKTQKEVLFHLHNKLSAIDVPRSPAHGARVTPATVEKTVTAVKGKYSAIERYCGLLQQALAVVQCVKSPRNSAAELMQALQRQAAQNLLTSRDSTSVLLQISNLIKTRKERNLPLERLLALTVYIYSLAGHEITFNPSHEDTLLSALGAAIFEDHRSLYPDEMKSPEECEEIAEGMMKKWREVRLMRTILTKYGSILKPSPGGGVEYKGVLQQLMEDLLHPERPELPDLKHRSEGIKQLLRTGFNMLLNTSKKKHPLDNPLVIVLIVGGSTAEECRTIRQAVISSGTDARVLVATTRLAHPTRAALSL